LKHEYKYINEGDCMRFYVECKNVKGEPVYLISKKNNQFEVEQELSKNPTIHSIIKISTKRINEDKGNLYSPRRTYKSTKRNLSDVGNR
jgi:hypothetical protein